MAHNREEEQNSADLFSFLLFLKIMSDLVRIERTYYDNNFTDL
nr:MAG TPA: hypothetical protein [Caudoviricetes sp.]